MIQRPALHRPNRLAFEKSPYLLQHADNPVDWYPWGEEAFHRAQAEQKPIFLSIGYSTCHFCHVMERESFADLGTAALLNESFVSVKVDREERPEIDQLHMEFVQATTGSGGWPLSVFLTPSRVPFYGGTYFRREDFQILLREIARTWAERREEVLASGSRVLARLKGLAAPPWPELLDPSVVRNCVRSFGQAYDAEHGGFGAAPKFPRPAALDFLLRVAAHTGDQAPARMAITTLKKMAEGGICDHLGGGFHRYSVDRFFRVPHFEKMLYDQAQLVAVYCEAYQLSGDPDLAQIAAATCDYVLRDLTDPETGAFYSAEDADSEGREGAFYVWTFEEIQRVLGDDAAPFCAAYGVTPEGNARDPRGELAGKNVLYRAGPEPAAQAPLLLAAKAKLSALRQTRPRPQLDDKVLTAWNGLMLGALARASQVLGRPDFLGAAQRAATFIRDHLWDEGAASLHRRYRAGEAAIAGGLADYSFLAAGLIDLYEAGFDPAWLTWAERLIDRMNELFWDLEAGGWFTSGHDPSALVRMKDDHDGAEPSGNAIATQNLLRLAELCGRPDFAKLAPAAVRAVSGLLRQAPHAMPQALVAYMWLADGPLQIVIAGERDDPRTSALLRVVSGRFLPHRVLLFADTALRRTWSARLSWIAGMTPQGGRPTAYVCRGTVCDQPTADPDLLDQTLNALAFGHRR